MIRTVVCLLALFTVQPALASPRFDTQPVLTSTEQEEYDARIALRCSEGGLLMVELEEVLAIRSPLEPSERRLIAYLHENNCLRNPRAFMNDYRKVYSAYQALLR